MDPTPRFAILAGSALAGMVMAGCASEAVLGPSAVPAAEMRPGEGSAPAGAMVETQGIVTVADRMARGILGLPRIANAKWTPRIVLEPVVNQTGVAIDRAAFLVRIRILLNQRAMNEARFLDSAMLANLRQAQPAVPSADPNVPAFRGADYLLTSRFDPVTRGGSAGSGSILYRLQLRDAHSSEVIWEGAYEIGEEDLTSLVAVSP